MTAINDMLQQPVPQAIGWALLQFIWQGTLIGVVTAALLFVLRRGAADVRYVVSTIALALMLTMPIVTTMQSLAGVPDIQAAVTPDTPIDSPAQPTSPSTSQVVQHDEGALDSAVLLPATFGRAPLEAWLPMLLTVWLAGVATLTLRLLSSWMWVQRMKSHGAVSAGEALQAVALRLSRLLHITRPVRFLESSLVDVPTVIGWVKPVVLLPASVLAGLTPQQLEAILAHELAHIRRHDYLVNLLQTVVETLLFYHPAVWWLSRRIRIERENCCDDLAVSLCGDPVVYAAALAELEGLRAENGHLVLAASGGSLVQRVRRVLGAPSHAGRAPGWLAAGVAILVIGGICAGAAGNDRLRAETVAASSQPEQDPPQPVSPVAPEAPQLSPAIDDRELAERRAFDAMRELTGRISRQKAVERCFEWARSGFPDERLASQESTKVLRNACEAFAAVREQLAAGVRQAEEMARHEAAVAELAVTAPTVEAELAAAEQSLRARMDAVIAENAAVDGRISEEVIQKLFDAMIAASAEQAAASTASVESALAAAIESNRASEDHAVAEAIRAEMAAEEAALARAAQAVASTRDDVTRQTVRDRQASGNYTWSDNGRKLEVNYRGDIQFTDDDTDVRSISPGGWLRIKDGQRFGTDNAIEFRADANGRIERRFWVGSSERPFEPEGRKWVAEMLPRFIRQTGIGAEGRVARIYKAKGAEGVLAEISLVEGSWARRVYFTHLLKIPSLSPRTVQQALAQAGREIDSDFELASLLISSDHLVKDDGTRQTYLEAARTINSDFEMRRVFSAALKNGPVSPALLAGMLETSANIGSDFEEASLLEQIAKLQPLDATIRAPFFKALATVGGAFEQRRVLTAVLRRSNISTEAAVSALEAASAISSDFEAASVLLEFVKANSLEGPVRAPFFKAAATIGSPFERSRVLQAAAKRTDASEETVLAIIRAAQAMSSSFEKAQVLLTVAGSHALNRQARDAYIDASENLGSFEQGRVLSALVKNERGR